MKNHHEQSNKAQIIQLQNQKSRMRSNATKNVTREITIKNSVFRLNIFSGTIKTIPCINDYVVANQDRTCQKKMQICILDPSYGGPPPELRLVNDHTWGTDTSSTLDGGRMRE